MKLVTCGLILGLMGAFVVLLGCQPTNSASDDATPTFAKDVNPFLQTYCVNCHGATRPKGGVNVESFDSIAISKKPLLVAGNPDESKLCQVCEGKGKPMPPKKSKQPTAEEVQRVRNWISEGAKNN